MKAIPELSIIIPTYNEEAYLPSLFSCLEKQSFKNFEVIVSDANSKDKTRQIAKSYGAFIVDGGIPSIGRNTGAKKSSANILVFIDADVTFDEEFIEKLYSEFIKTDLDFAVPYFHRSTNKISHKIFFFWSNLYKKYMQYTRFPDGTGQLSIVKKKAFDAIGGYPEYKIAEDTELFWKAARLKYKVGTINVRFFSSTRRLEKVGVFWVLLTFNFIALFMFMGVAGNKRVQKFASKLYGGMGK